MQAIVTRRQGWKAQLALQEVAAPGEPGPKEVLVQVQAASVNPKDWKLNLPMARLTQPVLGKRQRPLFGDDLAGTVVAVGDQVTDLAIGDAVYGMDMRLRTASLAEQTLIHHQCVARKPASLSFTQAAAMPLAGLTALQGLRKGQVKAGSQVLIIGASGGVGHFAVQIAKALGAHVTGVCSARNLGFVQEMGADAVIDYTAGDYRQSAGPFDLVFDVTSFESPRSCAALLAPGGWFISTGGDAFSMLATPLYRLGGKNAASLVVKPWRQDLEALTALVEAGTLRPVIESEFAFVDSDQAYQRSRSGRCRGKVVIRVGSDVHPVD
ncbi:MAG: NAD(P)-dependent alcohol dehydrogenase [Halomonadaceae bacterium]|nr:MAG: NAD(P)-dependent alcohol dehydrogenase [Halomonadaceae bacterium]